MGYSWWWLQVFPDEGKLSHEEPAGGKWSVQAQDSVVHDETTADVYVNASTYTHTLLRTKHQCGYPHTGKEATVRLR